MTIKKIGLLIELIASVTMIFIGTLIGVIAMSQGVVGQLGFSTIVATIATATMLGVPLFCREHIEKSAERIYNWRHPEHQNFIRELTLINKIRPSLDFAVNHLDQGGEKAAIVLEVTVEGITLEVRGRPENILFTLQGGLHRDELDSLGRSLVLYYPCLKGVQYQSIKNAPPQG